jgi:addiction module HigA family antidote
MPTKAKTMPPIHPGETLREDFLKPLGLTANRLASELFVPVTRVNDIVRGRRAITADTALRLARYFGTTPQFWINLQSNYDLELAQDARGSEICGRVWPPDKGRPSVHVPLCSFTMMSNVPPIISWSTPPVPVVQLAARC